ncbi:MAG: FAD-binding oxidoreductase [Acetobacteraceae bacterium]|nr:FAD-binding oxidoreductase [Acetobacteraceae bacterium]MCX7684852.1 FAD-binding oxidoreductase [Acetobacteraceae bacterium]MDW8397552.1 FAD-binding oxidoreductase [Acetobacteraceae bacterium]
MSAVIEALAAALPGALRLGPEVPGRNRADWSGEAPAIPRALLLPRSTQEVSAALAICHAHGQPVCVQGGMTGLAGGATPAETEVALSLERMSGIEELDEQAATLTALAGTPLALVQQAAEAAGFRCGVDLGARGSCTIGGNVATNAGGVQVLRYGMARRNVLGLEAVLADGTILSCLNKMLKNNAGWDWTQLFIGSEGCFGVVTRVVLALHPAPSAVQTALCAVPGFAAALALLRRAERALPRGLLAFEAMWADFYATATGPVGLSAPLPQGAPLYLLIEAEAAREAFEEALGALLAEGAIAEAVVARSEEERRRLWALRESPAEYRRCLPPAVGFDVSVPLARMEQAVAELRGMLARGWPQAMPVFFGHVADSNLHLIVPVPGLTKDIKRAIEEAVYAAVARFGGSVSAEHGIGRLKRPFLPLSRSGPELALLSTLKQALDPKGILNPGRVLP